MTIAAAAIASAPLLSLVAQSHTSAGNDGGEHQSSSFAEQLSGFTVVLPDASAWRSGSQSILPQESRGDTTLPQTAAVAPGLQALSSYQVHLPADLGNGTAPLLESPGLVTTVAHAALPNQIHLPSDFGNITTTVLDSRGLVRNSGSESNDGESAAVSQPALATIAQAVLPNQIRLPHDLGNVTTTALDSRGLVTSLGSESSDGEAHTTDPQPAAADAVAQALLPNQIHLSSDLGNVTTPLLDVRASVKSTGSQSRDGETGNTDPQLAASDAVAQAAALPKQIHLPSDLANVQKSLFDSRVPANSSGSQTRDRQGAAATPQTVAAATLAQAALPYQIYLPSDSGSVTAPIFDSRVPVNSSGSQTRDRQSDAATPQAAAATVAQAALSYQIYLPSDSGSVKAPIIDGRVPVNSSGSQTRDRQGDAATPQAAAATLAQATLPYQIYLPSDSGSVTAPIFDGRVPVNSSGSKTRDRQGDAATPQTVAAATVAQATLPYQIYLPSDSGSVTAPIFHGGVPVNSSGSQTRDRQGDAATPQTVAAATVAQTALPNPVHLPSDPGTATTPILGSRVFVKSSASQSRDGQSDTGVPQTAAATVAQAILPYQIQLPSDLGDVTTPTLDSRVPARGASSHGSSPSHDFSPQSRDRQGADASNDSAQIQITAPAAAQPLPQFTAVSSTDGVPSLNFDPGIASKPPVSPSDTSDVADTTGKPTVTAAAGSAGDPQQLAFAARVQPVQSVDQSTLTAEMAANAAMASASKKVPPATGDVSPAFASAQLSTSAHTAPEPVSPAIHSAPEAAAPTQRAEASTPLADSLPKTMATPLKDISLQVTQAGKDPVDVRVVQQGGEVHVSVHSGDASLASGLRQGLSDLQSRLEENGYRSEMWRPVASMPLTQTPSAQSSSNHSRGGDGQPQQGGSQQDSGRRNQNQSNQPRWVEELESSFTSGDKSSGDFHGFGS